MDLYQLLGVDRHASQEDIKAAYKKLALRYHPDKNPGSKEANDLFQDINNAYQILSNPNRRIEYDQTLNLNHRVTSSGDTRIDMAVLNYLNKEKELKNVLASYLGKPNFRWPFIFWVIFSVIVWSATMPDESDASAQAKETVSADPNSVIAIEDGNIYTKPNIASEVKYIAKAGSEFTVMKKTKYFALVSFETSDSTNDRGYILLEIIRSK